MTTLELGSLEPLDPRDIWPHEAHDFTPWLLTNAETLGRVLGLDLEMSAAEHAVGGFSLDLLGRDLTNDCVLIVENQLTPTDHTHLGQLVTYAAGTDARTVIWTALEFREEHRQAIDFLNELGGENVRFFGVEIGVVRIGGSLPAPLFKLAAQPNDWHAQVTVKAKATSESSGKAALYRDFWTRFLDRARAERPNWTNARKPQRTNWFSMACPFKGGPNYSVSFAAGGQLRAELYIDYVDSSAVEGLFARLVELRPEIDDRFGGDLSWEELPGKRACRIAAYGTGDVVNESQFDEYIDWFFETMGRLREAIDWAATTIAEL